MAPMSMRANRIHATPIDWRVIPLDPSNECHAKPPCLKRAGRAEAAACGVFTAASVPVRRWLRGALRGSARLVTLGAENDARSPDTRQSTCRVWWGDDWARAFLITGSDAEDSRLELLCTGRIWAYY